MNNTQLEGIKDFKYLGYTWTSKLAMYKSVANYLDKVQRSYVKLKWLKGNRGISAEVLRQYFFAYSFPFFAWLFCLFPFLPVTQQQRLIRKFRAGLRLVHRCHWVTAQDLYDFTKEKDLVHYVKQYIRRRLSKMYKSDLASSLFPNDISFGADFKKRKKDGLGHFFQRKRVKNMILNHKPPLIGWLDFIEDK